MVWHWTINVIFSTGGGLDGIGPKLSFQLSPMLGLVNSKVLISRWLEGTYRSLSTWTVLSLMVMCASQIHIHVHTICSLLLYINNIFVKIYVYKPDLPSILNWCRACCFYLPHVNNKQLHFSTSMNDGLPVLSGITGMKLKVQSKYSILKLWVLVLFAVALYLRGNMCNLTTVISVEQATLKM